MRRLSRLLLLEELRLVLSSETIEALLYGIDVGRHKVGIRAGMLIVEESERGSGVYVMKVMIVLHYKMNY